MNKKNPINISKSSLVGLQAELARKREDLSRIHHPLGKKSKKLELKPLDGEQPKISKTKVKTKVPDWEEEEDSAVLNRSKEALITKSALYDKLRNQELQVTSDITYLVDFQKNDQKYETVDEDESIDEYNDPESEWVTFKDSLGRTRTCLRDDVSYYKKLDSKLSVETRTGNETPTDISDRSQSHHRPVVLSEEMRLWDEKRENLRKMWEKEEERLTEKKDIHYQDILFDEARMHGVGYFQFSKDEAERQKQHEELRKLREETEKNQQQTISMKERREQQMKQRIEAAKRRKRERLGLPPLLEDEVNDEEMEDVRKEEPKPEEILAKKVEEYLQSVERSRHVRPWDVGKDGVNSRVMSQEEYNEKQRTKRVEEFAPPSTYKIDISNIREEGGLRFTTKEKKRNFVENIPIPIDPEYCNEAIKKKVKVSERRGMEIPPPSSYNEANTSGKLKKSDLSESIEMGLNRLRREAEAKITPKRKAPNIEDII